MPADNVGVYFVKARPTVGGVYDVSATMENAATDADKNIDIVIPKSPVYSNTFIVVDNRTLPSYSQV